MTFKELLRRSMLVDSYNRLSESDKQLLLRSLNDKSGVDNEQMLLLLNNKVDVLNKKLSRQNWAVDFGSDLLANITTDSMIWLLSKLLKK